MSTQRFVPRLGVVEETLLITLYARAVETRDPDGLLNDPRAVEMVESVDYDFSRFDGKPSLTGACLRTLLFDHWIRRFLADRPDATVAEIGTGLNTRFERVDNGRVRWIDLDLPDAIALRRRFFPEDPPDGRRRTIAGSVLDTDWMDRAARLGGPWFFALEAVLPYLAPDQVPPLVAELTRRFPGSWLATETVAESVIADQAQHDVLSLMRARMSWSCDDPADVESWAPGIRLRESVTLAELPPELVTGFSAPRQELIRVMAESYADELQTFKVNLFQLGAEHG